MDLTLFSFKTKRLKRQKKSQENKKILLNEYKLKQSIKTSVEKPTDETETLSGPRLQPAAPSPKSHERRGYSCPLSLTLTFLFLSLFLSPAQTLCAVWLLITLLLLISSSSSHLMKMSMSIFFNLV